MQNNQNSNSKKNNSKSQQSQKYCRVANDSKQWITEKCGTNTPPSNPPKRPSSSNTNRK